MTRFRRAVLRMVGGALTAALLATVTAPTGNAGAPAIRCGATLTQNAVLTSDLTCAGDGLTLARGVTLDLAGHRLLGSGSGTAITAVEATRNSISNGVIQNWSRGIAFTGPQETLVNGTLKLTRVVLISAPLQVEIADLVVNQSVVRSSPAHLWVTTVRITNSVLQKSFTDGEMNEITLRNSVVVGGGLGMDENNYVDVYGSRMIGTGFDRPAVWCLRTMVDSTVSDYRYPIDGWDSCPAVVSGSTFRNNSVGLTGSRLTVRNSTFVGNGTGIRLYDGATSSISGSTFTGNTGSGIYSETAGLTLTSNTAVGNGGYGIYAPGANDRGGNVARRNGVADCVGLVCATG